MDFEIKNSLNSKSWPSINVGTHLPDEPYIMTFAGLYLLSRNFFKSQIKVYDKEFVKERLSILLHFKQRISKKKSNYTQI